MDEATARSLGRAADVVARRADATVTTERLGLRLSHLRTVPGGLAYQRYTPSLSVVLAGRKRSVVGDDDRVWGLDRFFITPVDLPVLSGVVEADERYGFLSARWRLDPGLVTEVAAAMPRTRREPSGPLDRLGAWTPALADAFARLLALLDEPEHIPLLAPQFARETVLRLLQTAQAPRVLAAIDAHDPVVPRAVRLLTERIAEPWTLDALAAEVGASRATLSRRFKQATSMTPTQYLKRLRLGEARHRMVVRAASAVGYRSAPHFSRDYRLVYGTSPAADAARAREQLRDWTG
ncbi:AraC family transcriptional regulator [Streptomyces sp. SPB074]|uniref:AraC family transcriptional regulator n=1 Tax=Streptomyces sp. (strain SPB074) TaxID=465543 RepID=UPI00056D26A2|nr:AraC family transcriptional regulator [Streptomyces sp. SPB074]